MLDLIKKIIGQSGKNGDSKVELENPQIALCVLLLEAAHVDGTCSEQEQEHLIQTLVDQYQVNKSDIEGLLVQGNKNREEAIDIFQFTRYMNNNYSHEEKIKVMEAVWRIILIDDHLEAHEDHFAHKLANLLRLTHKELIEAKLTARKQLA